MRAVVSLPLFSGGTILSASSTRAVNGTRAIACLFRAKKKVAAPINEIEAKSAKMEEN
jgi:hypothetical protein